VRTASLTSAGRAEREVLDRRSDRFAQSLLAPLAEPQRERLVMAMGEVERLLTAAVVKIAAIDPDHPHARHCLSEYAAELDRRFSGGFDPGRSVLPDPGTLRPPTGLLVVASLHSEPIGCGALRFIEGQPPEIKRMWVAPSARGLGVGRRLLAELEDRAAQASSRVVRLETNQALGEAIAMYRSAGYMEVEPFNDELYAHHWFEKRLV
jgi:ribosomal protein S18 acetylase RimI-like enzyme